MASDLTNVRGGFPTRNWQTGVCPHIEEIGATALSDKVLVNKWGCFACSIKCGRRSEIRRGPFQGKSGEGPEFETVGTFGGMCAIEDLEAITMIHYICNEYGIDTISAGNSIGFAMECFEKGILTPADTDGLELTFGNYMAAIEALHKIARKEGLGELLAMGVKRMSEKLGKGSDAFAMHVKGLELPAYDSRAVKATGLAYATANRGGDHMTAYVQGPSFLDYPFLVVDESRINDPLVADPKEAQIVFDLENALNIFDCVGACKFMGMGIAHREMADMIAASLGWSFGLEEFKTVGERVYNLARAFSIREGLTVADDTLPQRLLNEPLPEGPAKGCVNELQILLDAYYDIRGWDKATGKPKPEKLKELDLEELIPDLWG